MKKFVIFPYGFETPTPEVMEEWSKWFASIGDKMVDPGSPLGPGREITRAGTTELPVGRDSLTGYTIINAKSLDEAEKIAKGCPMIASVRVYEAMSMQCNLFWRSYLVTWDSSSILSPGLVTIYKLSSPRHKP